MTFPEKPSPPGRTKIMAALSTLLVHNDFHSITTAGIAREAGVTEGLIYKYFKDKKDLLYQVLGENLVLFHRRLEKKMDRVPTATEKIKTFIQTSISAYMKNRVLGRILLLEVKSSPDYFNSRAHETMKEIEQRIIQVIAEGISEKKIRAAIEPKALQQLITGAIEHSCLEAILFNRALDCPLAAQRINEIVFKGIQL